MKLLLVLFLIVFFSFNSFANEIIVKVSLSPAGSFEAKSLKLKGEVKKIDKKFTADQLWVKTEELKTGIDLRDEHFHKYLNYEKNAKIFFSEVVAENGVGSGNLTVNEVKKNIKFTYKMINNKKLEAIFKVKPTDFNLKEARYMEIGVEDEVVIVVTLDL